MSTNVLTYNILKEIISDTASKSLTLERVGLVGSFSRGDYTDQSDVDLVFDTGDKLVDEAIMSAGLEARTIIGDQFGRRVDIINYDTIIRRVKTETDELSKQAYNKMLVDLKWIWRKNM